MVSIRGEETIDYANIAIVSGSFYSEIAEMLLKATTDGLISHGVPTEHITVYHVPGALEIPLTIKKLAESDRYSAIIALGCVIRGETAHFDYVSEFSSQATSQIGLDYGLPVINGILTVENDEQAFDRADANRKNKGLDFALATIQMINLLKKI